MADSFVQLPADSSGKQVDTRTEATNGNHRQVICIGDQSVNADIAPCTLARGLAVDLTLTGANATAIKVDGSAVTQPVSFTPATSGGLLNNHLVAAATTNPTSVKASAGQVYGVRIFNNAAYPVFVKLHNTAGAPTAGVGVVKTFGCQAGTQANIEIPSGYALGTGIAFTIVKGITDADATAVAASDCVVDIEFK